MPACLPAGTDSTVPRLTAPNGMVMAWFFHIVEQNDGRWACRHGRHEYDTHARLEDAIAHVTEFACAQRPAEIYLHHLDGHVESVGLT